MEIVGIVGLPGSGKTALMNSEYKEHHHVDEFNHAREEKLREVKMKRTKGSNVVIACIELYRKEQRERLERDLGQPVKWIFFKNEPEQCARNVVYRALVQKRRPGTWIEEIYKIHKYSQEYHPSDEAHPVCRTPEFWKAPQNG